jgi:PIN domain nuclease of toxin-antitoxin system
MAAVVHLDTHVVVWLYTGMLEKIPRRIQALIERSRLGCSPMAVLELQYLHEIGRVKAKADVIANDLRDRIGLSVSNSSFANVVTAAAQQSWTRDPFDRLIAAQALIERAELVTADEQMRSHVAHAVWA